MYEMGTRYSAEFVNRLYKAIIKHTKNKTNLYCFTDNNLNINKDIICKPLPKIKIPKEISNTPWRKISVCSTHLKIYQETFYFLI